TYYLLLTTYSCYTRNFGGGGATPADGLAPMNSVSEVFQPKPDQVTFVFVPTFAF
ncbi:MAG: hypothetical protein HY984_02330, partial [Candidatus Magasanikbacteria bacterium]|nr:hypothetical protein [Candidatus Magasanikbacteria bacterium]